MSLTVFCSTIVNMEPSAILLPRVVLVPQREWVQHVRKMIWIIFSNWMLTAFTVWREFCLVSTTFIYLTLVKKCTYSIFFKSVLPILREKQNISIFWPPIISSILWSALLNLLLLRNITKKKKCFLKIPTALTFWTNKWTFL